MINFFNYLLVSNIFTGAFVFNNGYFDLYIGQIFMAVFLLFYIIYYRKITMPRSFLYILAVAFSISLINVFQGNDSFPALLKIVIGLILNGLTYYLLLGLNDYKVDRLFRIYMQMACVVALIAIFQEISYLVRFEAGYDFRYFVPRMINPHVQGGLIRVTSIMEEPAHLGAAMAPALFVSILNVIQSKNHFIDKKASWLVIVAVLLTFSIISYLGIIFSFILIMLNYKGVKLIVVCTLIMSILGFTAYKISHDISWKINDTIAVFSGKKPAAKANLSTFALCSNGFVAYKSFRNNPLIGLGLGSHPFSYDRYISQIIDPAKNKYPLNREDASGLFLRLLSETGLLGVLLTLYFIFRFHVSRKKESYFWVISNAILCIFILNLLRQGNYFYNGLILFIWLYYFTYKNALLGEASAKN